MRDNGNSRNSRKRIRIYPYKMGSKSAKGLKEELTNRGYNVLLVKPDGRYRPRENDTIINWGISQIPNFPIDPDRILNKPMNISIASDKLDAFCLMKLEEVSVPEFTTDVNIADDWIDDNHIVIGRYKLSGHSGEGIEIFERGDDWFPSEQRGAPLYVKYIKKSKEYRIHIFNGEEIDVQQKKKKQDIPNEEVNYKVRSYNNGWVFCRGNIEYDNQVIEESKKAVVSLGLDFGAVDVIWNEHYQKAYVLEVNTAPGLEGTTLIKYADAIERELQEIN